MNNKKNDMPLENFSFNPVSGKKIEGNKDTDVEIVDEAGNLLEKSKLGVLDGGGEDSSASSEKPSLKIVKEKTFEGIKGTDMTAEEYLLAINKERAEKGLPPLEEEDVTILEEEKEDKDSQKNVG